MTLREREEKFHQVADNIQEIFWMVDATSKQAIYVNPAFERITGRTVASLMDAPLSYREIIHPDDRLRVLNQLHEAATTGKLDEEFRIVRPDGTIRWVGAHGFPVRDAEGKIYRLAGVVVDITARRIAEEALRESEDRYRDLVEHSEDLVCTHDLEGTLLSVNPAPARVLGYEASELLKTPMRELIAPEYRGLFDEYLARIKVSGSDKGLMVVLPRTGGRRTWEYSNTLRTEGVASPIVRGMAHDVTERRRAEIGWQESEERFRVALKGSPITVFNQDRELRYTWIYNPQLYWQHEAIGKTDMEIIGAKKAASLVELKRRALETGVGVREDVMVLHEGRNYVFDITIEPLFGTDGKVIGIIGTSMDIARFREMTDRLQDARDKLAQEKSYLESEIQAELGFEEIIGQSPALREVLKKARVVAPTDSTVLLLGETGTGKELVARSVHALSSRRDKTFIKLNCAAVPEGLLESELFGHEKGAFTSAVSQKVGRIELADRGTLFLDEIGELPLELQPKLLRVLQDREFERLGGVRTLHVDVRIISATNRDLQQDIADRSFREDLFYRLNVFPITLPALRQRRTDIPILVHHFVRKHAARMGKHIDTIPDETMTVLQNWNWAGNIRELENMIERMVILSKGRVLAAPPVELDNPQEVGDDNLPEMEREHIIRVLRETNGVLSGPDGAASRLGIKRTTLQSMLKRHGIELHEFRRGSGTFGPS
jgi:PAS domain S-box-containing protein